MSRNLPLHKLGPAYWADCLQDERQLAPLMGWARVSMPEQELEAGWLWGSNRSEFKSIIGPDMVSDDPRPLPRWRRDHTAMGSIIERVPANIRWDAELGLAHVWIDQPGAPALAQGARFADHPSDGYALRKALVLLAITYLTERRAAA